MARVDDYTSGTLLHPQRAPVRVRGELGAAILAIVVGVALMGVKFTAYFLTGSAAIFSDAMEGIVNVAAAAFATYAIFLAHRPPDLSHPYGHGKVEFIAAGFEGGMILLAAVVAVVKAVDQLLFRSEGPQIDRLDAGIALMVLAAAANLLLGAGLVRFGKARQSIALEADGRHLLSDVITSLVALAGLGAVKLTGRAWLDPAAAIAVAAYIAVAGAALVRRSVAGLMDMQDATDDRLLRSILDAHVAGTTDPRICSYHKVRHRHSGRYHWVDFHVVVPATWDVARGHEVASRIEYEIECALGEGNATAHVEPCDTRACAECGTGQQ